MIRVSYIFLILFAMAFLFQIRAIDRVVEGVANMADVRSAEAVQGTCLRQNHPYFLFVYCGERVWTSLTRVREHNRQSSRNNFQLLKRWLPCYKCITDLDHSELSSETLFSSIADDIVSLHRFRI